MTNILITLKIVPCTAPASLHGTSVRLWHLNRRSQKKKILPLLSVSNSEKSGVGLWCDAVRHGRRVLRRDGVQYGRSVRLLSSKMVHVHRRFRGTCYLIINSTRVYINDRDIGLLWNITFRRDDTALFQKAIIFAVTAVRTLNRNTLRSYVRF